MKNKGSYITLLPAALCLLISCGNEPATVKKSDTKQDSFKPLTGTIKPVSSARDTVVSCVNDSLDELAKMIAGIDYQSNAKVLKDVFVLPEYKTHSQNFDKKWNLFDTTRMIRLKNFRENELTKNIGATRTLFYPFSGPDILYGYTFFPDADKYILMGLEPVGSRPLYDEAKEERDSLKQYFSKINTSLRAILQFSFFRTASMREDLKNEELDGTLHLLLLFLARTQNQICDIQPVYVDTNGLVNHAESFIKLKSLKKQNKGIEIRFTSPDRKNKVLYYYSLNLADAGLKHNKGILHYLHELGEINTYLKGASYLMHKDYFSLIRNFIFDKSNHVVQDDSGIAFHYFEKSGKWDYVFYGKYLKPIPMFAQFYQKDLDSLYKQRGSKDLGFGIGYNFKDRNSNLMIATRK